MSFSSRTLVLKSSSSKCFLLNGKSFSLKSQIFVVISNTTIRFAPGRDPSTSVKKEPLCSLGSEGGSPDVGDLNFCRAWTPSNREKPRVLNSISSALSLPNCRDECILQTGIIDLSQDWYLSKFAFFWLKRRPAGWPNSEKVNLSPCFILRRRTISDGASRSVWYATKFVKRRTFFFIESLKSSRFVFRSWCRCLASLALVIR